MGGQRTKWLVVVVGLLLAAVGLSWLGRSDAPATGAGPTARARLGLDAGVSSGPAATPGDVAAEAVAADFSFRGVVLALDGGFAEGVWVEAFSELNGGVLSELPCACAVKNKREDEEEDEARCDPLAGCACESDAALLAFLGRDHDPPVAGRARTGAGGAFTLTLDGGSGCYRLHAAVPGGVVVRINLWPPQDALSLQAWPDDEEPAFVVHGKVVDDRGRGVAGAPVMLLGEAVLSARRTTTDASGAYTFEGVRERGTLLTAAKGVPPDEGYANRDGDEVILTLAPARHVSGQVLRQGAPASGIPVWADTRCLPPATSDGAGRFSLALPVGNAHLTAEQDPWHGEAWVEVKPGADPKPVTIELSKAGRLEGLVIDTTGRPIAGATVRWRDPHPPPMAMIRRGPSMATDGQGRFTLPSTGGALWQIDVSAAGHLATGREVAWEEGEVKQERFVLADGALLAGQVVDATGAPVRGAQLEVEVCDPKDHRCESHYAAQTGADGRFHNDRLEPGPTRLTVTREGLRGTEVPVVLPDPSVHVVLHAAATLSGKIEDASGKPPPSALVFIEGPRREYGWPLGREAANADGTFSHPLSREGAYRATAMAYEASGASLGWSRQEFTLGAGEPAPLTFRISGGAPIQGLVQDEQGVPVAGARVLATLEPDPPNPAARSLAPQVEFDSVPAHGVAFSSESGAFSIQGLGPGHYEVWVFTESVGRSDPVHVDSGASSVVLKLKRFPKR